MADVGDGFIGDRCVYSRLCERGGVDGGACRGLLVGRARSW